MGEAKNSFICLIKNENLLAIFRRHRANGNPVVLSVKSKRFANCISRCRSSRRLAARMEPGDRNPFLHRAAAANRVLPVPFPTDRRRRATTHSTTTHSVTAFTRAQQAVTTPASPNLPRLFRRHPTTTTTTTTAFTIEMEVSVVEAAAAVVPGHPRL